MYELFRVLRSVGPRILETHERGLVYNGLCFQTLVGGCPVGSDEYQARIRGIQNLRMVRPWSDALDGLLFLEGFAAGVEFQSGSGDSAKCKALPSDDCST